MAKAVAEGSMVRVSVGDSTVLLDLEAALKFRSDLGDALGEALEADDELDGTFYEG
jgi:hypothetical protein